jgi:hypothetical protein
MRLRHSDLHGKVSPKVFTLQRPELDQVRVIKTFPVLLDMTPVMQTAMALIIGQELLSEDDGEIKTDATRHSTARMIQAKVHNSESLFHSGEQHFRHINPDITEGTSTNVLSCRMSIHISETVYLHLSLTLLTDNDRIVWVAFRP